MLRIIYHIIMNLKTIKEIAVAWLEYKRPFVKDSTFAAYALTVQNHIVPAFGESCELPETDVQQFVLQMLENGISVKTIKDILIVLKMVMKYGVKQSWLLHAEWDIKYPTSSATKPLEVLSITDHKKILAHIRANFNFQSLGIYVCGGRDLRAVSGLRGKLANVLEAELGGFALCRVADFEAKSYNSDRQDNDKGDKNDVF